MKPLHLAAVLALGLSACVESPPSIQLYSARQPDTECAISTTGVGIAKGGVDLAFTSSYRLALFFDSNTANSTVTIGTQPVNAPNADPNAVYLDTLTLSYSTSPAVSIPSEDLSIFSAVRSGSKDNYLVADLLTQKAADALALKAQEGPVEVLVTVKLSGKTTSGAKAESNEVSFPLTAVYGAQTVPACPAGTTPEPTGPCGNAGQDGQYPSCKPASP